MTPPRIDTPRGAVFIGPDGKAVLRWNTSFQRDWMDKYTDAQKFVDSEVLRRVEPFVPLDTGTMIKSGILGTEIGGGLVQWLAPYSRHQYYAIRLPGSQTGALRGPFWFERMKQLHGRNILAGAKKIAGGGV